MTDTPHTIAETVEAATGLNGATLLTRLAAEGLEVVRAAGTDGTNAEWWEVAATLQAERDALAAQVARVRALVEDAMAGIEGSEECERLWADHLWWVPCSDVLTALDGGQR